MSVYDVGEARWKWIIENGPLKGLLGGQGHASQSAKSADYLVPLHHDDRATATLVHARLI